MSKITVYHMTTRTTGFDDTFGVVDEHHLMVNNVYDVDRRQFKKLLNDIEKAESNLKAAKDRMFEFLHNSD